MTSFTSNRLSHQSSGENIHRFTATELPIQGNSSSPSRREHFQYGFKFAVVAAALTCVIFLGRQSLIHFSRNKYTEPIGTFEMSFEYNKSFASSPWSEAQVEWDIMFPRGRGFVQHPVVSPEPTCVSLYHQLHCLDALRRGYWAAIEARDPGHHTKPSHVRHCIDYLRQALLCNADTNLEPIDFEAGGVNGFGSRENVETGIKSEHGQMNGGHTTKLILAKDRRVSNV